MVKVESDVEFNGDDVWVNGDLISKCDVEEKWFIFGDVDTETGFETLEEAVTYCLEHAND